MACHSRHHKLVSATNPVKSTPKRPRTRAPPGAPTCRSARIAARVEKGSPKSPNPSKPVSTQSSLIRGSPKTPGSIFQPYNYKPPSIRIPERKITCISISPPAAQLICLGIDLSTPGQASYTDQPGPAPFTNWDDVPVNYMTPHEQNREMELQHRGLARFIGFRSGMYEGVRVRKQEEFKRTQSDSSDEELATPPQKRKERSNIKRPRRRRSG